MKNLLKMGLMTFALSVMMSTQVASAMTFSDVDTSTPYFNSIMWMADQEVINGHPDGTFKPADCVNRAEILKMVYLANEEVISNGDTPANFSDIDQNAWYAPYVNHSVVKGTIEGYADGTFRPGDCVNRAEAIKIATLEFFSGETPQIEGWAGSSILKDSYVDVFYNEWYGDYLEFALLHNLVGQNHVVEVQNSSSSAGVDRYYAPNDGMSRGEVAEMLYRMKAAIDNDSTIFVEDSFIPNAIGTLAFDNCGVLSDYASENWYSNLTLNLADEDLGERLNTFPSVGEACLSLDGETLVFIVPESGFANGDARVYKYDTVNDVLDEASYQGFVNYGDSQINPPQVILNSFEEREGAFINMTGVVGDAGSGVTFRAEYYYADNRVVLVEECTMEMQEDPNNPGEFLFVETGCLDITRDTNFHRFSYNQETSNWEGTAVVSGYPVVETRGNWCDISDPDCETVEYVGFIFTDFESTPLEEMLNEWTGNSFVYNDGTNEGVGLGCLVSAPETDQFIEAYYFGLQNQPTMTIDSPSTAAIMNATEMNPITLEITRELDSPFEGGVPACTTHFNKVHVRL